MNGVNSASSPNPIMTMPSRRTGWPVIRYAVANSTAPQRRGVTELVEDALRKLHGQHQEQPGRLGEQGDHAAMQPTSEVEPAVDDQCSPDREHDHGWPEQVLDHVDGRCGDPRREQREPVPDSYERL